MLAEAADRAAALMEYVKHGRSGAVAVIQGKDYLKVEAWTTAALFSGLQAQILEVERVPADLAEPLRAYKAWAGLYNREGQRVAAAMSICSRDEPRWAQASENAVLSMAQTRATSKACRLALSFIVVLAGYQPTPAEEVEDLDGAGARAPAPRRGPAPARPAQKPEAAGAGGEEPLSIFGKTCPACGGPAKWYASGIDKRGKPYEAFGACLDRECNNRFNPEKGGWRRGRGPGVRTP